MNRTVSRVLWGAFFVGGLSVLGVGAANAADTTGEDGIASGNQIGILGELPITVEGNSIAILGDSGNSAESTPAGATMPVSGSTTSGEDGIASGNQVMPDVAAPVTLTGNSIAVFGDTTDATAAPAQPAATTPADSSGAVTTGEDGIASGNQVMPDVVAPITATGNSIAVFGDTTDATAAPAQPAATMPADSSTAVTTGEDRIAAGNQLMPGVAIPTDVGGNNIGVLNDVGVLDGRSLLASLAGSAADDGIGEPLAVAAVSSSDGSVAEETAAGTERQARLSIALPVSASSGMSLAADAPAADAPGATAGPTPLMATAALAATTMLAATGTDALPVLGAIALLVSAGLTFLGYARVSRARLF